MYRYFSKRNQMSAVLKADFCRARTKCAAMLRPSAKAVPSGLKLDVDMTIMSPQERHELCWRKW